jgi:hypothetical protein
MDQLSEDVKTPNELQAIRDDLFSELLSIISVHESSFWKICVFQTTRFMLPRNP